MKPHSKFNAARRALLFWCLFIGIGAVAGAVGMLAAPDGSALGMEGMLPYFQVLPPAEYLYQDFVFPSIALLCVNGIPNLIAAALLFRHKKAGIISGGLCGTRVESICCRQGNPLRRTTFTRRRKPSRRLADFRPLPANEWQETSSDFFSDFVTYPL